MTRNALKRLLFARFLVAIVAMLFASTTLLAIRPSVVVGQVQTGLSVPQAYVEPGNQVTVAITFTRAGAPNPTSFDFTLSWDTSIVSYTSHSLGPIVPSGWFTSVNTAVPGKIIVSSATASAGISSTGSLFLVTFKGLQEGYTPLQLSTVYLANNGTGMIPAVTQDGGITVTVNTVVTPPAPTFNVIDTCGETGSVVVPSAGTGYSYTQSGNGTSGLNTVVAHAASGYIFAGNVSTLTWGQDLGTFKTCAVASQPAYTPINACNLWGEFTQPANSASITWSTIPAAPANGHWEGEYTVKATANSGYAFENLAESLSFLIDFGDWYSCSVTPVAPSFTTVAPGTCNTWGTLTIHATEGVIYHYNGESYPGPGNVIFHNLEGVQQVTSSTKTGFAFAPDAITSWSPNLGDSLICATPIVPTFNEVGACSTYGTIALHQAEGVIYHHNGHQYSVETTLNGLHGLQNVTTSAQTNYLITGTVTSWLNVDLGAFVACPTDQPVIPDPPTAVLISECGQDGSVTLPTTFADKVTYTAVPANAIQGQVVVTAEARNGFYIPANAVKSWTFDLGSRLICATPTEPQHENAGIGKMGKILLPTIPGIEYTIEDVDAIEGKVKVTARVKSGYGFPVGTTFEWIIDLGDYLVPATPVQPTVTPISACGEYGSVVFATTTGVTYAMTPADAKEGKVTVAASPWPDYGLVGYDGPWEYELGEYKKCPEPSCDGIVWLPMVHRLLPANQ